MYWKREIYSVKHTEKLSKGHENKCQITQGNGLHRCQISRVLLYMVVLHSTNNAYIFPDTGCIL